MTDTTDPTAAPSGGLRWTGHLRYSGRDGTDTDEIQVVAPDANAARDQIERAVRAYPYGWILVRIVREGEQL